MCLVARCNLGKLMMKQQNRLCLFFVLFDCLSLESILAFKIDYGRSENFLLFVRTTFRGIIQYYKSLYLKINFN